MVMCLCYCIEKRVAIGCVQQLAITDGKECNWVLMDGVCVLWGDVAVVADWGHVAVVADWGQFILVVKEEHVLHIQVLHEWGIDVHNPINVIRTVGAKKEEQVLDTFGH